MKHLVYIVTDCNRSTLQIGLTTNLKEAIHACKMQSYQLFDQASKRSRLVYFEEWADEEVALGRLRLLNTFTRAQLERLIRRANQDWKDLSLSLGNQPPAAFYSSPLGRSCYA